MAANPKIKVAGITLIGVTDLFTGATANLSIEFKRFYARFHGGDQKPEGNEGDRWIATVKLRRRTTMEVYDSVVFEARVYGIDAARAATERFLWDLRSAAEDVEAA